MAVRFEHCSLIAPHHVRIDTHLQHFIIIVDVTSTSDDPSLLVNRLGLDLGVRSSGERVEDVLLPPWANSPQAFLEKLREVNTVLSLCSRYSLSILF